MKVDRDEQIQQAIEQQAAVWFVRHRESELSPVEHRQYMQWLRASPRHVEAYLSLIELTARLPQAIASLGIDADALARKISQLGIETEQALFQQRLAPASKSHEQHRRWMAWAAMLAALLVAPLLWTTKQWMSAEIIVVPAGQQRILTLEDGSTAHLDSNTRIELRYSNAQRLIELSAGRGLFNVRHDVRRPFIVRSGRHEVVAVGTKFDVYRDVRQTQVTVVEGRVAILAPADVEHGSRGNEGNSGPFTKEPAKAQREILLTAGEQVKVADVSRAAERSRVDPQRVTAWSRNEISFAGARLEEVAAQFTRNTGARISIEERRLRDYRVSGVFQAYDLDSFVAYLGQFDGVVVARRGDRIQVYER